MKPKILNAKFWKNIFGLPESHTDTLEQENVSQEPIPTIQPSEKESHQNVGTQGRLENSPSKRKSTEKPSSEKNVNRRTDKRPDNSIVRSELNLEKNSVFTTSNYKKKSREFVIRETNYGNSVIERKVVVGKTAEGAETGVLNTGHFRTYLALIELWEKAGRPISEPVHFTIYRITKKLDLKDDGRTYAGIKRLLYGLRQIPIEFVDSFFTPEDGNFRSLKPFTVLSYLDIYERRGPGKSHKTRGYGEFQFDRHILVGLISNYTHPLRLDVINSFKKHKDLAILVYTYIDRNLAFKDKYEIKLENLFDTLDLSQRHVKYASDRKRVLEPVLDQLLGKELSTGILSHAEVVKTVDGQDYKLVCRKKPFPKKLRDNPEQLMLPVETEFDEPETLESSEPSSELFPLLIENGLTEKQAAKLIAEKGPEDIKMQVEYLPYRVKEYKAQKKEINMPAILYDSISDNWNIPKGYIEARKIKEREAKRIEAERIALEEREEWDRAEQERERIKAYKESLSSEDRAKLREEALEQIRSMEGVKEGFITDMLIELKENEILRERMGD